MSPKRNTDIRRLKKKRLKTGFLGPEKICALNFKICPTFFEICPTYFQPFENRVKNTQTKKT